ncbi:hypothetical protein DH2020_001284 [Rehmannia glutinosa]|uniref:Uncharacterized protein n=1 Tax=Rehmannia glutinosa TaxID=99300 RepID=A0ABR0XZM3_REHGL
MEDLMKLIKNFIDMLILASGYQSTGRLAHWDSRNIKKCFQWALFLESVSKDLTNSVDYQDSVKELDAALCELTSNTYFPQGLAPLSCITLGRARNLLLKHLIHTLPLRESHLKAILTASVEMDFSKLKVIDDDYLDVYLEKLMRIPSKGENLSESRNFMEFSNISSPDAVPTGKHDKLVDGDFSVSLLSNLGEGNWHAEELPVESIVWSRWRSRSLSYMLDKRTIRLISGANLICSAPEDQRAQMFERLNISDEADDLCEAIELLLLGCIADRWGGLIEHLMSVSYESLTISRLYHEVFNLQLGKSLNLFLKEGLINPKGTKEGLNMLLSTCLGNMVMASINMGNSIFHHKVEPVV